MGRESWRQTLRSEDKPCWMKQRQTTGHVQNNLRKQILSKTDLRQETLGIMSDGGPYRKIRKTSDLVPDNVGRDRPCWKERQTTSLLIKLIVRLRWKKKKEEIETNKQTNKIKKTHMTDGVGNNVGQTLSKMASDDISELCPTVMSDKRLSDGAPSWKY